MEPKKGKVHPSTLDASLPDILPEKRIDLLAHSAKSLFVTLGGEVQMGRQMLCTLIGCRDGELAGVCRAAGITMHKKIYREKRVKTLPELLAIPLKTDDEIGGYPVDVKSTKDKKPMRMTSPTLKRWAMDQIIAMGKLTVRYRCSNVYRLEAEAPAPTVEAKPEVEKQLEMPLTLEPPAEKKRRVSYSEVWLKKLGELPAYTPQGPSPGPPGK